MSVESNDKAYQQLSLEVEQLRAELAAEQQKKDLREAELCRSEERFAHAMRGASDGLWDWDLQTDKVYYSPRWKEMLGYREDELDDSLETWANMVHPDEKKRVLRKVKNYLDEKEDSFEVVMRMRHKNGSSVYIRSRAFKVIDPGTEQVIRLIGTHVDITDRKKAEEKEKQHSKILEMIAKGDSAKSIYDAIAKLYEERNPGVRCSMVELDGNKLRHGGAPSLPKEYCDMVDGLENGPNVGSCGTTIYTGKKTLVENITTDPKWVKLKKYAMPHGIRSCWSEPVVSSTGDVLGAFAMYRDFPALPTEQEALDLVSAAQLVGIIMEKERDQKRIRNLAYADELTGLANRARFISHLQAQIKTASRNGHRFALTYIDIDNFKDVNDSLGHDVGDLLLKEIASRLASVGREIDFIARIGGDEFCIIISELKDELDCSKVTHRCLDSISQPLMLSERTFTPTCSIGIALFPNDGQDEQSLLKAADTALYAAKNLGKNCYAFYKEELTKEAEYRFKVEHLLREAIVNKELTVAYQPQIDLISGRIIGFEALSRWYHPQLGHIPPCDFIETAERIGMIKRLTETLFHGVCQQLARWKASGLPSVRMAINISPSHFLDKDLVPSIAKAIQQFGLSPSNIKLEVTETSVQTNQENLNSFKRLKQLGVLLAIDDFGIGYSSFASLKHIRADVLKIDKYFIEDMINDDESRCLVESMIKVGHDLGQEIIAEGIESQQQLSLLKSLGCETGQGYLFSKPVSAKEAEEYLKSEHLLVG